jgi:hypothetical protein
MRNIGNPLVCKTSPNGRLLPERVIRKSTGFPEGAFTVPLGRTGVVEDDLNNPAPAVEGSVWYELHYRRAKAPTLMVDGALDRCARDDLMFTAGLAAPLEGGGVLVLDLDGVTSMDRFGARAVLELRSALARRSTKLRLVNIPPCVTRALRSIGVPTIARGSHRLN